MVKLSILLIVGSLIGIGGFSNGYASPSFPEQIIPSGTGGYFPEDHIEHDSEALNLEGAYYKSDGKTLDARLIVYGKSGFEGNNTLSYGMLIDSDSNFNTGRNGFDYRYRVQWENNSWFEIYEELPTDSIIIKEISKKKIESVFVPNSIEHSGLKNTVKLSLDLDKIGNPELFAIVFFSEGNISGKNPLRQDVLSLAVIPPPEFVVSTDPSLISFESSTEKVIHIIVNSDIAETTVLYYNVYSKSDTVTINPLIDNSVTLKGGKAIIPILIHDQGHDDLKIHELKIDLDPWYAVNPETQTAERGGEIFDSYHFRNQQNRETYTIFWSSLAAPSWDWQLPIQIAILFGTALMAIFAFFTYKANAKIANYDRNEKHKHQILGVYDLMKSLVLGTNDISKELLINYPEKESDRFEAQIGSSIFHSVRISDVSEFNGTNVLFYDSALQHLKEYEHSNNKWNLITSSVSKYNQESNSLIEEMKNMYLKFIKEKLPDFTDNDINSENVFYIDNIVRSAYEILDDVSHERSVDLTLEDEGWKLSDQYDQIEPDSEGDKQQNYLSYRGSTLLFSTKPFPKETNDLLGLILTDSLKTKHKSLLKIRQDSIKLLDDFRDEIKDTVKKLSLGEDLKGKCKLGY